MSADDPDIDEAGIYQCIVSNGPEKVKSTLIDVRVECHPRKSVV